MRLCKPLITNDKQLYSTMNSFLFLADGFEEIEALTTVDVMRRAGMDVKTVSINKDRYATGAHGVTVAADVVFDECRFGDAEWLILPGGMPGAANLHNHAGLTSLLRSYAANGKGRIAAICAAPAVVLAPLGILKGREVTCYPGFEEMCVAGGAVCKNTAVVESSRTLVTANGPAAAMSFALAIVHVSKGMSDADVVAAGMLYR